MEGNANKLRFKRADFNSSTRVTVYAKCMCVLREYLKYLSIKDKVIFSVRALRGLPLPCRISTVPVSLNFFNSLLTPRFVQLFSGNAPVKTLCCVLPLQMQTF